MKNTAILLAAALLTAATASAQKMEKTSWTDRDAHIYIKSDDGTTLEASVGFAHDASSMAFKRTATGVFVATQDFEYECDNSVYKIKSCDCPKTGKTEYLYKESSQGKFMGVFVKDDGNEYDDRQEFFDALNGTYTDKDGKKYVFNNNTLTIDGKKMSVEPIRGELGFTNGVTIDGKNYCFKISETGINIYTTNNGEWDMDFDPVSLWVKLRADLNVNKGRWPITNQKIVLAGYLSRYSKSLLRLMRNEIYARHGYKFASADLTTYFSKTNWYQPGSDNSQIKISDLEQLNINIIKHYEDNRQFYGEIEKGL